MPKSERLAYDDWRWAALHIGLMLGALLPAVFLWRWILLPEPGMIGIAFDGSVYTVRPDRVLWVGPGVAFAFVTAALLAEGVLYILLGDRYIQYSGAQRAIFEQKGIGARGARILNAVGLAALIALALATVAVRDWRASFGSHQVVVDPFFGATERTYDYSEVRFVTRSARGLRVEFTDGSGWYMLMDQARNAGSEPSPEDPAEALLAFLAPRVTVR